MTVSNRDKKLIIALIGVLAAVLSYFFVFKPMSEKNQALENENIQLSSRLADLRMKQTKEEDYVNETERMNQEVAQILTEFPSYLQIENGIMDVVALEDRTGVDIPSVTIADPVAIEVASTAAQTAETTDGQTTDQTAESSAASQYLLYDVNTNLSYTATYTGMKEMVDMVATAQDKRSVSTFSATFDNATGEITGALSFESYFIFGQEKDYEPADIPSIKHGTSNIFGSVDYDTRTENEEAEEEAEE
jgi:hypothetical protein